MESALIEANKIGGYLSDREARGLFVLAVNPTCPGRVVEIGTFKGKSAVLLAKAVSAIGEGAIVAVDPHEAASVEVDLSHYGKESVHAECMANFSQSGVENMVEFHQLRSTCFAKSWPVSQRIRLLWIDGDHTYSGAKGDLEAFAPYLADGAIVAMHDVLHEHGGPTRAFAEGILLSKDFSAFGFFGSVGWAQFDRARFSAWQKRKLAAYKKLSRLIALTGLDQPLDRTQGLRFRIARALVPHGNLQARWFRETVNFSDPCLPRL